MVMGGLVRIVSVESGGLHCSAHYLLGSLSVFCLYIMRST